jgi:hypothetical protein
MAPRKRPKAPKKNVILLKDLAPRQEVTGGAKKLRFGEPAPKPASIRKPSR